MLITDIRGSAISSLQFFLWVKLNCNAVFIICIIILIPLPQTEDLTVLYCIFEHLNSLLMEKKQPC